MKILITLVASIWPITAAITHIWTIIIAFNESGFFSALITLFIPFLSEIYWIIQMIGENSTYVWVAIIHLILAIPISLTSSGK